MGAINPGGVGVTQSLPSLVAVPSESNNTIRAICSLPCRYMGHHRKTQVWHGISPYSTRQDHQRREGVWSGSSVGTPAQSPPPLCG